MEKTYASFMDQSDARLLKHIEESKEKAEARAPEDQRKKEEQWAIIDRCGTYPVKTILALKPSLLLTTLHLGAAVDLDFRFDFCPC